MRSLIRLQPFLYPNSTFNLFHAKFSDTRLLLRFSHYSSSVGPSKPKKFRSTHLRKPRESETRTVVGSIFSEITNILGSEGDFHDGVSVSGETESNGLDCTPSVRGNSPESVSRGIENVDDLKEKDVSPVVHRVTQIVRKVNDSVPMEARLERSGIDFLDPEIVDKVLKRCFKVPRLATRFFDFVRGRDGFSHTSKTYNTMLYIAGEAREFGLVEELVEEMGKSRVERDIKTWTILISHYGKAKMIGRALEVYEEMVKSGIEPDGTVHKAMIRSLCDAGKAEIAMEFYKEMAKNDVGLDLNLYKMLLSCAARSGDMDGVRLVAEDMMRVLQVGDEVVYGFVLKSLCISGRIREALEFIRDHKDKELAFGYDHFETLLRGLCRADRIGDALEIFGIMKKRQLIDRKIYGIVISGYLRRNEISKALSLFQGMKESGHCPTGLTYTELMQHLFRVNRYEEGCKLYSEMLEAGIEPDIVAITAVVAGHVRAKRVSEAWEVFRSMEGKGFRPTWKSYSVFVRELCRISRLDEILKVLNEMQAYKIAIGDDIFHWVISYMERKGETANLERVKRIQRMSKFGDQPIEQKNTAELIKKSDNEATVENFHPLKTVNYDEKDLKEVLRILSSSSLDWPLIQEELEKLAVEFTPELVVEVLRNSNMNGYAGLQFFSWLGKRSPDYRHTSETYNEAVKLAGRGKDFKHMRNLFHEMRRNRYSITPDTWTIMIMQYGRAGLTELALKTFGEMKASKCIPSGSTYKYLIISLCAQKGRRIAEAIKLFQEAIRLGIIPDKELVDNYLDCLCKTGNLSEARKCVDNSIRNVGFNAVLGYSMYTRALCRAGRVEEALAMIEEIELGTERHTFDEYTYGSIIHGLLRKGRAEEALAKMDSMRKAGIDPPAQVYNSLIVHYLRARDLEKALETLGAMREEGCEPTTVTLSAFVKGYVEMGNVVEAWNMFGRMRDEGPRPDFKTYSMFMRCLCKVGESEDAIKLLDEMLKNGMVPSSVNFRTVMFGLNREGKPRLARTVMHRKQALLRKRKFSTC